MAIEMRVLALLAGGWACTVSLVNIWLITWGASAASAAWAEPVVVFMRFCVLAMACATLLFALIAWPPLLGTAFMVSAVLLIVTWGVCLGLYQDVSEIIYAAVVTLVTLPGTLGLGGLWLEARADPPTDRDRPIWLA